MTVAKFEFDEKRLSVSLHVKGHAGQNVVGHDIVCASVSILAFTIAQEVKNARSRGQLKYEPKIKLNDGDAIISARAKTAEDFSEILHAFIVVQTGYILLSYNYSQYVAVETFGDSSSEE